MTPPPDDGDLVGDDFEAPAPADESALLLTCPSCRTPQQVNPIMASATCVSCHKMIRAVECDRCHRVFATVKARRFQCPQCLHTIKGSEARTVPFQRLESEPPPYVPSEEAVEEAGLLAGLRRGGPLRGVDRMLVLAAGAAAVIALILGLVVSLGSSNKPANGSPSTTTTTQNALSTTTTSPPATTTTTAPPVTATTAAPAPTTTTVAVPPPTTTTKPPPPPTTTTLCTTGAPSSTISLESANQNPITGFWAITVGGNVTNGANGAVRDVVVYWEINYANSTSDTSESTLVAGGGTIAHGATVSWGPVQPTRSEGSVQPVSVSVRTVTFQYAC